MFVQEIHSQDVNFSQYIINPLLANPSYTGNFNGTNRINIGYRNQWQTSLSSSRFNSGYIFYDSKLKINEKTTIGYGASTIIDRAGSINFGSNQFKALSSINYNIGDQTNSYHLLSAGIEMGISNIGVSNLRRNYFDIGSGISWEYQTQNRLGIQIGTAIYHLNEPNVSISNGNSTLSRRYHLNGTLNLPISRRHDVILSHLSSFQGPHQSHLLGLNTKYLFTPLENRNKGSFLLGIQGRFGQDFNGDSTLNSINFLTSIDLSFLNIGLSYDYFLNGLGGAFECSFAYIIR